MTGPSANQATNETMNVEPVRSLMCWATAVAVACAPMPASVLPAQRRAKAGL